MYVANSSQMTSSKLTGIFDAHSSVISAAKNLNSTLHIILEHFCWMNERYICVCDNPLSPTSQP